MVAKTLEALGEQYSDAQQTVILELRSFLARVPGIELLSFSDDTKFASDETLMWINSEVNVSSSDGAEGEGEAPWAEVSDEAKVLIGKGKLDDAMALFADGIKSAASGRLNWQWRFALAQLLNQAGKANLVVPILRALLGELVEAGLVKWDSVIAKSVATLLFQSSKTLLEKNKDDTSLLDVHNYAYSQLCLIDPIIAISIKEK